MGDETQALKPVECPECKKTEWQECEPYCEDCGSHSGFECKECGHQVDHVWDAELYNEIFELVNQD